MTKCSVVLLSYNRPDNINTIIEKYKHYSIIDEIIVWNNNNTFLIHNSEIKVKIINCNQDLGLNTRFSAALLCKNRCVILHDDDLLLSEGNIERLVKGFVDNCSRVYTYEGRNLVSGKYNKSPGEGRVENVSEIKEADIALTRATCFDKFLAAEYLKLSDVVFYDVDMCLNGEDIALSYLARNIYGVGPLVLPLADDGYYDLPSTKKESLSVGHDFVEERNKIIDRCEIILPKPNLSIKQSTIFGPGKYEVSHIENSTCYNSKYSKVLVSESSGIKYLSVINNSEYSKTIATIILEEPIPICKNLVVGMFFKNNLAQRVDMQISYLLDEKEYEAKYISLGAPEIDYVKQYDINLSKFVDKPVYLTSIRFRIINDNKDYEFCVTNINAN
jgi:hypothetical protein